jgi:hypothetical protein
MTSSKTSPKKPRQPLKERLHKPGGITADEAIQAGMDALNEMRGDYASQLVQDIATLKRMTRDKPKVYKPKDAWWQDFRRKLHDMRSVAGTYDYHLVTIICDSLVDYLDGVEDDLQFDQVMDKHITALQHVASNDVRGKGGPHEFDMIKGLRNLVKDRKSNAQFKRDKDGT